MKTDREVDCQMWSVGNRRQEARVFLLMVNMFNKSFVLLFTWEYFWEKQSLESVTTGILLTGRDNHSSDGWEAFALATEKVATVL